MTFGKKASINNTPKKKLDINKDIKNKECIDSNNSSNSINDNSNNNDIININNDVINVNTQSKKAITSDFMKHIRKNKKQSSDILLFGLSKKEKLELFIDNLKLLHGGIPDFWFNKEVDEFKKKFKIE